MPRVKTNKNLNIFQIEICVNNKYFLLVEIKDVEIKRS